MLHVIKLLPVKVTWETIGTNTPIDTNPNTGGGNRIFPDKTAPTDAGAGRNKVTLRVNAGASAAGWKVYVQSFDVDDPTPDSVDVDATGSHHIIDFNDTDTVKQGNDNLPDTQGTGGATIPKPGFFTVSGTANDNATLDSNGKHDFEFNVGYQPGNNYRVAVAFFKVDDLNNLRVDDSTKPYYIPPEENTSPSAFSGAMSPPLTVWRRLWVEQDSMAAIAGNSVQGTVQSFVLDATNNQTIVTTAASLGGDMNQFENGNVLIDGTNYTVVSTTGNTILITGQLTTSANGKAFTLKDDDGWGLPESDKSMPQFGLVGITIINYFSPAYILVSDAAQFYTPKTVPFRLNGDLDYHDLQDNKRQIPLSSPTAWTQYVLAAYQPDAIKDGDPDTESLFGGEHLYPLFPMLNIVDLESVREVQRNPLHRSFQEGLTAYKIGIAGLISHELGHGPGEGSGRSQHNEQGIMGHSIEAQQFYSPSILRFRMSNSWTGD